MRADIPGLHIVRELSGGYQSRVWECTIGGRQAVVKAVDRRYVPTARLEQMLRMLAVLGDREPSVCGPIARADGRLLWDADDDQLGQVYVALYEFAEGTSPTRPTAALPSSLVSGSQRCTRRWRRCQRSSSGRMRRSR